MNRNVRYTLVVLLAVMLTVGMAFVLDLVHDSRKELVCKDINVTILDDFSFIEPEDVCSLIEKKYGRFIDEPIDSIRLSEIEELLESRSVILDSEAWTTDDGVLHIDISQRQPVIRCDRGNQHLYLDRTGYVFSSANLCNAELLIIEGKIPVIEQDGEEGWIKGVLELDSFIKGSKVWRDRIDRISVNDKADLVLNLRDSGTHFILGQPVEIENKFSRIEKFYSHIVPAMGQNFYKSVNLKYKNQLICRKDI